MKRKKINRNILHEIDSIHAFIHSRLSDTVHLGKRNEPPPKFGGVLFVGPAKSCCIIYDSAHAPSVAL